jgi:uncharacterized protein (DUF433 family)
MLTQQEIGLHITRDPEILSGKPIIRGTRMPVYLIFDFFNNGASPEEIVDDYPNLTIEDIEAAIAFSTLEQAREEAQAR